VTVWTYSVGWNGFPDKRKVFSAVGLFGTVVPTREHAFRYQSQMLTIIVLHCEVTAHGDCTMDFDWRAPKAYANIDKADRPEMAWECLRRDAAYQNHYIALSNPKVAAQGIPQPLEG
jgi:hypothetical protein